MFSSQGLKRVIKTAVERGPDEKVTLKKVPCKMRLQTLSAQLVQSGLELVHG